MSVQRASEVIALTSAQQTTEEDGAWITSNGQHIFIPNGRDQGEVLKEHFEKLENKSEPKAKPEAQSKKFNMPRVEHIDSMAKENRNTNERADKLDTVFKYHVNAPGVDAHELNVQLSKEKPAVHKSMTDLFNGNREKGLKELEKQVPELMPDLRKQLAYDDKHNAEMKQVLDDSKYVFRAIGNAELKSIEDSGKLKLADKSSWDFVHATISKFVAERFTNIENMTVLRIDTSKLGDNLQALKHTPFHDFVEQKDNPENYTFGTSRLNLSVAIKDGTSADAIDTMYTSSETQTPKQANIEKASSVVALIETTDSLIGDIDTQDMDDDGNFMEGNWITVKGSHIFIPDGKKKSEAIQEFYDMYGEPDKEPEKPKQRISDTQAEVDQVVKELDLDQSKIDKTVENFEAYYKKFPEEDKELSTLVNIAVLANDHPDVEQGLRDNNTLEEFDEALETGDYETSDKLFINAMKDHRRFEEFKKDEVGAQAFNVILQKEADKAKEFYRYTDIGELDSYLKPSPTFGVSTYAVGEDADYKCLTVERQNKFFGDDKEVIITYPADKIRKGSKTARYTQFPRSGAQATQEKISSSKNSAFASETEVRINHKTKVPVGDLQIEIKKKMNFKTRDKYIEMYGSLGTLTFTNAKVGWYETDEDED